MTRIFGKFLCLALLAVIAFAVVTNANARSFASKEASPFSAIDFWAGPMHVTTKMNSFVDVTLYMASPTNTATGDAGVRIIPCGGQAFSLGRTRHLGNGENLSELPNSFVLWERKQGAPPSGHPASLHLRFEVVPMVNKGPTGFCAYVQDASDPSIGPARGIMLSWGGMK